MGMAVRVVNLALGSVMVGAFCFGAASVAVAHRRLPPAEAWAFHGFVSLRVDRFVPFAAFLANITGFLLLVVDGAASATAWRLTLAGALLLTSYGLPFVLHHTGLRNELQFVRRSAEDVDEHDAVRRMRWWNRWHSYRTVVGGMAQLCYIAAALSR